MGTNFIICLSFITILLANGGGQLNLLGLLLIVALFIFLFASILSELQKLKEEHRDTHQEITHH